MANFQFPMSCPFCGTPIDGPEDFKDKLSVTEFHISGLCQRCQNEVFAPLFAEKDFEENPYAVNKAKDSEENPYVGNKASGVST